METRETIGDWLLRELEDRGWSQSELARRAGIGNATLSRIISGTRDAGPDVARAIAQALGETPEKIYRLAGLLPPPLSPQDAELEAAVQEIAETLSRLPDGPIREQAMASLLAITRDALERAAAREREKEQARR